MLIIGNLKIERAGKEPHQAWRAATEQDYVEFDVVDKYKQEWY